MTISTARPSSCAPGGPAHAPVSAGCVPFFDASERPIVLDALYALEAQLDGGTPMPPVDDDALRRRICVLARRVGASPQQLVLHWIEWARGS